MKKKDDTALKTAEYLLQIKAIKLNIQKPFTWASGWKSPIYCDNRKILSYPAVRTFIRQHLVRLITDHYDVPELIAGVATAGIPHGVLVAQELGLPFVYVRSAAKDHGLENLIEGVVESGQRVVVVEDLISTGTSSLKAVEALRNAGCDVRGMAAIFTYGFPEAERKFSAARCALHTLSDYAALLQQAVDNNYILEKDLPGLSVWREAPEKWGK